MSSLEIYEGTKFAPIVVALEVTLRCNMRCLHCGSNADGNPRDKEMSLDQWKDIVDQLSDLGSEYFTLSGGEPFVWPHWRELAQYIRTKEKNLSVISNGYLIKDEDIEFLKSIGMWNIALSIDGMKETHEKIRRAKNSFDHTMKAIRSFKKAGIRVAIATSINKLNFADLPKIEECLNEAGVDLWQIQIVNSFGRAGELRESLLIEPKQYIELVEFIRSAQQRHEDGLIKMKVMPADSIGYCHGISKEVWKDMEWSGCNAGRYVMGIQSNGDVLGCLSLQHKNFIAGNVQKKSLKEIWEDDEAFSYNRNFDKASLNGPCEGCSHGEQCRGGCLAMGYSTSGKMHNNPYCYKYIMEGRAL